MAGKPSNISQTAIAIKTELDAELAGAISTNDTAYSATGVMALDSIGRVFVGRQLGAIQGQDLPAIELVPNGAEYVEEIGEQENCWVHTLVLRLSMADTNRPDGSYTAAEVAFIKLSRTVEVIIAVLEADRYLGASVDYTNILVVEYPDPDEEDTQGRTTAEIGVAVRVSA